MSENYLVIDGEWTIGNFKKGEGGDPFDPRNKLCLVGTYSPSLKEKIYKIEYDDTPFGLELSELQRQINSADLLVLFNAKRDLHWLRRYGIRFQHKRIWDCQLVEFNIGGQSEPYPSLDGCAERYGLGSKEDVVWNEYWSKGIDTDFIPRSVLDPYLIQDLLLTEQLYLEQRNRLADNPALCRLCVLCNIDLLILEEMEWNGIEYDVEESLRLAEQTRGEIRALDEKLAPLVDYAPVNWNSGDHLSCILYGGTITVDKRVPDGTFKTGKKTGQTKYRIQQETYKFPRLVNPLKGSELDKDGYWSTAEPTLKQLNARGKAKQIIEVLLYRAKLDKLVSSYYEGLPRTIATYQWPGGILHGTLNQCVAATGRLSSSKPNLQNNDKRVEKLFRSRYE